MSDDTQIIAVHDDSEIFTIIENAESVVVSNEESVQIIAVEETEVIVNHIESENIITDQIELTEIISESEQGPPGPIGPKGDIGDRGPTGPVGAIWMGPWNDVATYQKNNIVLYYGSAYIYVNDTPSSGQLVSNNSSFWQLFVQRGADGSAGSSANDIAVATKDPSGFENRTDSSVYMNDSQRRLYIQPAANGGSYIVWISGQKVEKSIQESVEFPNQTGTYHAYFDNLGELRLTTDTRPLHGFASIAMIYWDDVLQTSTMNFEERHGIGMSYRVRKYIHESQGSQWVEGFNLTSSADSDGSSDEELRIIISDGIVSDEDNDIQIVHSSTPINSFEQILRPFSKIPVVYSGAGGFWKVQVPTQYPISINTRAAYNHNRNSLDDVADGKIFSTSLFATTNKQYPIISIPSSEIHDSVFESMKYQESFNGIPSKEFKKLYTIHYRCNIQYLNSFKASVVMIEDFRSNQSVIHNISNQNSGLKIDPAGDKHFVYSQNVVDTVWTINHGMNKYPSIEVVDSGGSYVEGDIEFLSLNTVELRFSSPVSGKVFLN